MIEDTIPFDFRFRFIDKVNEDTLFADNGVDRALQRIPFGEPLEKSILYFYNLYGKSYNYWSHRCAEAGYSELEVHDQ